MSSVIRYEESQPMTDVFFKLYESTGWNEGYGFAREELHEALKQSWYMVAAYDAEELVGFGRVLSDGVYHAFICEMIVLPDYQGKGIGKEILERLVAKCQAHNIRLIQVVQCGRQGRVLPKVRLRGKAARRARYATEEIAAPKPVFSNHYIVIVVYRKS